MTLNITGMIESGQLPDENGVCIKYDLCAGFEF